MKRYKVVVLVSYYHETWIAANDEDAAHERALDDAICILGLNRDYDSVETTTLCTA